MLIRDLNARGNLAHKSTVGNYIHSGAEVKKVQELLIKFGIALPKYGSDGDFGDETRTGVKAFQKSQGLKADGIVGEDTLLKLANVEYSYFRPDEFKCNCGGKYCNGYPVPVKEELKLLLTKIREHFGKPVVINSAVRCKEWNRRVGGVVGSEHTLGTAADIKVIGVAVSSVNAYAKSLKMGGVGKYPTFNHVDVGKVRYW